VSGLDELVERGAGAEDGDDEGATLGASAVFDGEDRGGEVAAMSAEEEGDGAGELDGGVDATGDEAPDAKVGELGEDHAEMGDGFALALGDVALADADLVAGVVDEVAAVASAGDGRAGPELEPLAGGDVLVGDEDVELGGGGGELEAVLPYVDGAAIEGGCGDEKVLMRRGEPPMVEGGGTVAEVFAET
jgi:hypothetical protein